MLKNNEINKICRGFGAAPAAIGMCIRCIHSYTSEHSTLLQCKIKERVDMFNGVCSTEPFQNCKSFRQGKTKILTENTQTILNFDM